MKVLIACMKCAFEGMDSLALSHTQINDQNVYEFICPRGHQNVVIHQVEKFEMLFESAVHAIMDGYYREAVSSIAASLERLFEFAIMVISIENGLSFDQIEKGWKEVSKQSERQLGAFIFMYLDKFKTTPQLLPNKQVEFRNKVIHKGFFPGYAETIEYGEKTLEVMFEIVLKLKQECDKGITEVTFYRIQEMNKQARKINRQPQLMAMPSIIDLRCSTEIFKPVKLVDYLKERERK